MSNDADNQPKSETEGNQPTNNDNAVSDATQSVTIKKLDNSEVEITGEISVEEFESHRTKAVKKVAESVDIPGFRKGNVPEQVLVQKVGEPAILYEMAEMAIGKAYPRIIETEKIDAIGHPEIAITKIAKGNPLGFKAKTAIMPEVKLPDYKKIAEKVVQKTNNKPMEVNEEELEKTIDEIRKNWTKIQKKSAEEENKKTSKILGPDGQPVSTQNTKESEETLPDLTDDFVKKIGKFENVEDFKNKIKVNLTEEKKMRVKEKGRMEIMEQILNKTDILVPNVLIEGELNRMAAEFKGNITAMGLKVEDYFAKLGKSEKDMRKEWRDDAVKRVKGHLVLHTIAREENITVGEVELEEKTLQFRAHHKDADPKRVKNYLAGVLTTEKVFRFLEGDSHSNTETSTSRKENNAN